MASRDERTPTERETLADAGNTMVPAILTLRSLGFVVRSEARQDGEWWFADRADLALVSNCPLTLLGLAMMRSVRGATWRATDAEIDAVLQEFGYDT